MLAIITGGDDKESRYFQRPMCVEELMWAIEAGVKIVPVVTAADKPKVGEYPNPDSTLTLALNLLLTLEPREPT